MLAPRLKEFLDANGVKYITIPHRQAYTAMEVAETAHVRGQDMAKTVIVDLDGRLAMAVLPATKHVSVSRLEKSVGAQHVEIAHEGEFRFDFPDCEVGAMPPFGNLFNMEVLVDPALAEDEEIVFNAGTHAEVVRMAYKDFDRLVHPRTAVM
ncbi:deacylase [Geothrix limicola]|uniref:Deacylase n=1 Tax=Geothrix limicola TaxID=2927978 RepID=A0ABQ5QCH4_9BACT|nr:YbaK/EbsC family protein [Geothrix limicola]GLH72288.1 deacylase [Geothrix limicola]